MSILIVIYSSSVETIFVELTDFVELFPTSFIKPLINEQLVNVNNPINRVKNTPVNNTTFLFILYPFYSQHI